MYTVFSLLGLQISGYEDTLTVGKTANISCSSDLDITSIVWLDSDMIPVVESVTSDVRLQFLPVSTVSHGQRYTCRVYSPYGIQEKVVTISSRSKLCVCLSPSLHSPTFVHSARNVGGWSLGTRLCVGIPQAK